MVFLNHFETIPWEALKYMVAEANYGGRVTDPNDRTCISVILEDFYNPSMLKDKHKLVESGKYYVPSEGDLTSYQNFITSEMPINDFTEIFGLHDNAEITSAINITNTMMEVALGLQGSSSSGGGSGAKS
jgi:dynein heavy chain, axonemal